MTAEITDPKLRHAIELYLAGKSIEDAAKDAHVWTPRLRREISERGFRRSKSETYRLNAAKISKTRSAKFPVSTEQLVEWYEGGMSEKAIAEKIGTSRIPVRKRLVEAGVHIRNRSEAMYLRMAQASASERKLLASAANKAAKGREQTLEEKRQRALTNEARQNHVSSDELLLQRWLDDRGITSTAQKAIGIYNVDLAVGPVAVEVFGGGWHGSKHSPEFIQQRFRDILDEGWLVLIIWIDRRKWPLRPAVVDHVVSLAETASSDPSTRGQYWVVRGDGEALTFRGRDLDKLTDIPTLRGSLNSGAID